PATTPARPDRGPGRHQHARRPGREEAQGRRLHQDTEPGRGQRRSSDDGSEQFRRHRPEPDSRNEGGTGHRDRAHRDDYDRQRQGLTPVVTSRKARTRVGPSWSDTSQRLPLALPGTATRDTAGWRGSSNLTTTSASATGSTSRA